MNLAGVRFEAWITPYVLAFATQDVPWSVSKQGIFPNAAVILQVLLMSISKRRSKPCELIKQHEFGNAFAPLFGTQVYLPEKFSVLFPHQNDFHGRTGGGTVVFCPLKMHSVLLKNNLQECSSVDYYHIVSFYIAARGCSHVKHKGYDSASSQASSNNRQRPAQIPTFSGAQSPFPSHNYIFRGWMLLQIHTHFLRAWLQKRDSGDGKRSQRTFKSHVIIGPSWNAKTPWINA